MYITFFFLFFKESKVSFGRLIFGTPCIHIHRHIDVQSATMLETESPGVENVATTIQILQKEVIATEKE